MPDAVFEEWFALYTMSPWDMERLDIHFALLRQEIAAANTKTKEVPKLKDLLIDWYAAPPEGDPYAAMRERAQRRLDSLGIMWDSQSLAQSRKAAK